MPNYSRQFGANISGITAVRLIDKSVIISFTGYTASTIATPIAISDINKVYSFMQLNGTGDFTYSQEITDAGISYNYTINWAYAKNRVEVMPLLEAIATLFFCIAVVDSNGKFMLIGSTTEPMEVTVMFDVASGSYKFEATGKMTTPPQFITGIFNPQLYTGGTGTV